MPSDTDDFDDGTENREIAPPPSITRELFLEWRMPRVGTSNPELMPQPVWEWLVRSRLDGFHANKHFDCPCSMDAGPCWCFNRYGQTRTILPDGRRVLIAGEHEDSYDPDFYIYNDVVVKHPDGRIDILGYPREVFPPTDFHSATLTGDRIIMIGNLGYPEQRKPGITQVMSLDLATFAIAPVVTYGTAPGWIFQHTASLSEDGASILLQRGKLHRGGEDRSLVENIDDWRLHLKDGRWERLTQRLWQRWDVLRADGERNHLWEIRMAVWARKIRSEKDDDKRMVELEAMLGTRPDLDLVEQLFRPPVPHETIPEMEDEYNVYRIKIDGVIIRYVVSTHSIQLTVEGELMPATLDILTSDLVRKLSALENAEFLLKPI